MTENDTEETGVSDDVSPTSEGGVSNATPEATAANAAPEPGVSADEDTPEGSDLESDPDDADTFDRDYVEKLRDQNAKYRQRAREADTLATRLHIELVRATGRLADPTDLPFDEEHIADADKMIRAIDDLLARKPHLATRRPIGEIGQGPTPSTGTVDLAAILRGKAG